MKKLSPLQQVKETHGSKEQLINKIAELLEPQEAESKDEFKSRLKYVANSKLLHLLQIGEKVQSLGGRSAIIGEIAKLKQQANDSDYKNKLAQCSLATLIDLHSSLQRRSR